MTNIISDLHGNCVDFLKKDENRKHLSITSGMIAAALTVAAVTLPLFPALCIAGIVGILMGIITDQTGKTFLNILDGGYETYPKITAIAAITSLTYALFDYIKMPAVGLMGTLWCSMFLVSLSLLYGGIVYEIGTLISDQLDKVKA
ncbi:MAG: hypothetical protein K1000chlam2_00140 [Chlamydiae bacterium]|nr:hypothetical protein [Chlamydiota bacterium]